MFLTKTSHSMTLRIAIIWSDYVPQRVLNISPKSCTKKESMLKYTRRMLRGPDSIP